MKKIVKVKFDRENFIFYVKIRISFYLFIFAKGDVGVPLVVTETIGMKMKYVLVGIASSEKNLSRSTKYR